MTVDPNDRGALEPTIGELVRDLASETTTLVRQEVLLAKVEMADKARIAVRDAGQIAAGGAIAHAGFLIVLASIVVALADAMPVWVAALIVGIVALAAGLLLARAGMLRMKRIDLTPQETAHSLKEDKLWLKEQVR